MNNTGYVIPNKIKNVDLNGNPLDEDNVPCSISGEPQALINNDGTRVPVVKIYNPDLCKLPIIRWIKDGNFTKYCEKNEYGLNTGYLISREKEQVSNDGGKRWIDTGEKRMTKEENYSSCPIPGNIFRWIDWGSPYCELNTSGLNTGYRIIPEKEQISSNEGQSWTDTGNTRAIKKLYDVITCSVPDVIYKWIDDPTTPPYCQKYNMKNTGVLITPEKQQKSLNNGLTWEDTGLKRQIKTETNLTICPVPQYIFEVTPKTINVNSNSQSSNVNVISTYGGNNILWDIYEVSDSWVIGAISNINTLKVDIQKNVNYDRYEIIDGVEIFIKGDRISTIILNQTQSAFSQTITVAQAAAIPIFTIDGQSPSRTLNFTSDASSQNSIIISNANEQFINWQLDLTDKPSWLTVTKTSNGAITTTVSKNSDMSERIATFKLIQPSTKQVLTVTVNQEGLPSIPCGQNTGFSGGTGIYKVNLELGTDTGLVEISCDAYSVADRFEVYYDGTKVADSKYIGEAGQESSLLSKNGQSFNVFEWNGSTFVKNGTEVLSVGSEDIDLESGKKIISFTKSSAFPTQVTLVISGPLSGTAWNISPKCPK